MKSSTKSILLLVLLVAIVAAFILLFNKKSDDQSRSMKKLVLIQYNDSPLSELSEEGIIEGLSQIGMTRDVDYNLKVNNAQGDISTLNLMIDDVINRSEQSPRSFIRYLNPSPSGSSKKDQKYPCYFQCCCRSHSCRGRDKFHRSHIQHHRYLHDGRLRWYG